MKIGQGHGDVCKLCVTCPLYLSRGVRYRTPQFLHPSPPQKENGLQPSQLKNGSTCAAPRIVIRGRRRTWSRSCELRRRARDPEHTRLLYVQVCMGCFFLGLCRTTYFQTAAVINMPLKRSHIQRHELLGNERTRTPLEAASKTSNQDS